MINLNDFETIAEAATGVFRSAADGGLGGNYSKFEVEIHRSIARQLKKHALAGNWFREVDLNGESLAGTWKSSVDFALVDKTVDRTCIRAMLEVKVVEQYRSNRWYGHEFPFLFYGSDLDDNGAVPELLMRLRLNELAREDTPENRERIVKSLQRFAPMQITDGDARFVYADEGALLYDLSKMISFAGEKSIPLFQVIYILTYTDAQRKNWEHVHNSGYLGERLNTLYSRFHEVSRKNSLFEVFDRDGKPAIRCGYRSFATFAEHRHLGVRKWVKSGTAVERNVSMVVLRHDLDPALPFSWKGDNRGVGSSTTVSLPPETPETAFVQKTGKQLHYGVFDVETKYSAAEVGGWGNAHKMGVSIAVLYDSAVDRFLVYREEQVPDMLERMKGLDLVIGFNNKRFDNKVLSGYTEFDLGSLPTLDLFHAAGCRGGLDNYARHTLGAAKSADGMDALRWYKEGRLDEIAHYCKKDVELTRDLYIYARENGRLLVKGKDGKVVARKVRV